MTHNVLAPVRRKDAGFSLIEVVVATTLLAFLAMLLLGGLSFGVRVMETGATRADRNAQLAGAYGFIRRQVAQALPLYRMVDGKHVDIMFDGRADLVAFANVAPEHLPEAGYQRLTLQVEREGSGGRLVARWANLPHWSAAPPEARDTVLLEDISKAAFSYYGRTAPNSPPVWTHKWGAKGALPRLLRLQLTFADGTDAPELTIALRLADAMITSGSQ